MMTSQGCMFTTFGKTAKILTSLVNYGYHVIKRHNHMGVMCCQNSEFLDLTVNYLQAPYGKAVKFLPSLFNNGCHVITCDSTGEERSPVRTVKFLTSMLL